MSQVLVEGENAVVVSKHKGIAISTPVPHAVWEAAPTMTAGPMKAAQETPHWKRSPCGTSHKAGRHPRPSDDS